MTPEEQISHLEARVRALEALMLVLPGLTEETIQNARQRLNDDAKRKSKTAALREKIRPGRPFDEDADRALADLKFNLAQNRSG
jgi:hypothetical protein